MGGPQHAGVLLPVPGLSPTPRRVPGGFLERGAAAVLPARRPRCSLTPVAPLMLVLLQVGSARTPSRAAARPPRPGHRERNKENVSQLNGTTLSGGCTPRAPAQRNQSINSVASTYSEFAVIHLFSPQLPSLGSIGGALPPPRAPHGAAGLWLYIENSTLRFGGQGQALLMSQEGPEQRTGEQPQSHERCSPDPWNSPAAGAV